jgi:hypothetical protein
MTDLEVYEDDARSRVTLRILGGFAVVHFLDTLILSGLKSDFLGFVYPLMKMIGCVLSVGFIFYNILVRTKMGILYSIGFLFLFFFDFILLLVFLILKILEQLPK